MLYSLFANVHGPMGCMATMGCSAKVPSYPPPQYLSIRFLFFLAMFVALLLLFM